MATRKVQKLKTRRKTKEGAAKDVACSVKPRRSKALGALAGAPVTAMLVAERGERDDELVEQIARLMAGRRRSNTHVKNDPGGLRSKKRVRITVMLEDDLIKTAQSYTGIKQNSALIQTALKQLIEREAARRLAAMGGTVPDLKEVPRRRLPGK